MPKPTINSIAAALGISKAAVSKALAGKPDIGPETRGKVREEARRQGYVPNLAARALQTGKTETVAVIFTMLGSMQNEILIGIQSVLKEQGYRVCALVSNQYWEQEIAAVEWVTSMHFDGLIMDTMLPPDLFEECYHPLKVPTVLLGRVLEGFRTGSSQILSEGAAAEAIRSLHQLGHRRIGLVMNTKYNLDKRAGAQQAAEGHVQLEYLHVETPGTDVILKAVAPHLDPDNRNRCTGFLCSGDDFAAELVLLGSQSNLSCPKDFSVIGFDDSPWTRHLRPTLSTVQQPYHEFGANAGRVWLEMQAAWPELKGINLNRTITAKFLARESIGPAPEIVTG